MNADVPSLSVVFENPRHGTGVHRYSMAIIQALRFASVKFKEYPIKMMQFSFKGKPYGGWISQLIGAHMSGAKGNVVHSTSPQVITTGTNLVTVHDLIRYKFPELYPSSSLDRKYAMRLLQRAIGMERISTVSDHVRNDLMQLYGVADEKIDTVYTFIDRNMFFPDSKNPYPEDGKFHVVTVTDFNPRKKTYDIADSLAGNPDIDLYVIGRKDIWPIQYSRVEAIAKIHRNVHLLGYLTTDVLRSYLSSSDLYIAFSLDEGIGIPPVEAMACGTNVLANDIAVHREFLGTMAFYFRDKEHLVDSVMQSLHGKKSREELVSFSKKYSVEATARQILSSYAKIDGRFGRYLENLISS